MFGQWEQPIRTDGRVTLPVPLRSILTMGGMLTRGVDGGVWLFPHESWSALVRRVSAAPFFNPARRQFERFLFTAAYPAVPDGWARIILPAPLREWATIDDRVVIVGLSEYMEIWAPAQWAERQNAALTNVAEAITILDEYAI